MRSLGIGARLLGLVALFIVCLLSYGAWSFKTLGELKVTGPLYQRIVQSKDLIADVLPPPEYIIESYLVALQITRSDDAALRKQLMERIGALKAEYDTRHEFWKKQDLEPELRRAFLERAHKPAVAFYEAAFGPFAAAVQAEDKLREDVAIVQMAMAYEKHRAAVDEVVKMSTKRIEADEERATSTISTSTALMLGILGLSLALSIAGAALIARPIVRKLASAAQVAETVAKGDLTGEVVAGSADEAGKVLAAMAAMKANLSRLLVDVAGTARAVTHASEQIATGNASLSDRATKQAAALEETAASMEELTSAVGQTAKNAQRASEMAGSASDLAVDGGKAVDKVVGVMRGIQESSSQISNIVGVIDAIAFQTNILALNAAVEAARAGEHGRGFAVVATEVRSLAQRSATAAKEVKALITASVDRVDTGGALVLEAGKSMEQIVASVKEVSASLSEISTATREQSSGIAQVNSSITAMDDMLQQDAAQVEEAAAAAESMLAIAGQLEHAVSAFKLDPAASAGGSSPPAPALELVHSVPKRGRLASSRPAARLDRRSDLVALGASR